VLLSLIIGLVVIALFYWALTYLTLPPMVRQIGIVVLVIVAVLWLIGVLTGRVLIPLGAR
jgi:hypothetical protein